jgi:coenzyme F420-reducing hydrogenase delta subunit
MNKKEKQERKRKELMIAIDYLERSQNKEYSIKGYEKTADTIKELNKQLKELNR